jgi:ABC-2 type transport system permease protein
VWSALIIAVSSVSRSSSLALIGLLGLWISFTVVVPRAGVEMASIIKPAPTQTSTYLSISEAIIGDAHNAADPAFDQFRADVLAQYSVDTIEELPVNYRGLVSLRAEEADSAMYAEFMSARLAAHTQQSALLNAFALLSPTIALRDISMRISGTSLLDHHAFLQAAEAYRYAMIQNYNRLHAELVDYQDDVARSVNALNEQRTRVDAANWASLPPFEMPRLSLQTRLSEAGFSLSILLLWFVAGCGLLLLLRRRAVQ